MKRTILILLSFSLIFVFSNFMVGSVFSSVFDVSTLDDGLDVLLTYVSVMGLVVALLVSFKGVLHLSITSLTPRVDKINLPLMLLGLLLIVVSSVAIDPIVKLMPESSLDVLYEMMGTGMWVILTGVVAAPILEEYIFRGVLQRSLVHHAPPVVGVILSALVFGLVHIIPQQMIGALMAGLILGGVFYITGSLTTVVVIHMLNNGLAYIQLLYFGSDFDLMGTLFPSQGHYWAAIVISWVVVLLFWWLGVRKIQKK
ncbi:MAG: type II CAAX endopeptidase family protein [Mucinivorans sp.]